MAAFLVDVLVPALISDARDLVALQATVGTVPEGMGAVVRPLIQLTESFAAGRSLRERGEQIVRALQRRQPQPMEPLLLGRPCGKWGALRAGTASCQEGRWIAVADGDGAYDLGVLPRMLSRARLDRLDLLQGQRSRILLDRTDLGHARSVLEPVLNELVRARLARTGVRLARSVVDLQSGLFLARRALLEEFFAQPRMDAACPPLEPMGPETTTVTAGALPWSHYGGELHLHAFAARKGARVCSHAVRVRHGRVSGLTPAAIGQMLRASRLFRGVTSAEIEAAVDIVAARDGWESVQTELARRAVGQAFPAGERP